MVCDGVVAAGTCKSAVVLVVAVGCYQAMAAAFLAVPPAKAVLFRLGYGNHGPGGVYNDEGVQPVGQANVLLPVGRFEDALPGPTCYVERGGAVSDGLFVAIADDQPYCLVGDAPLLSAGVVGDDDGLPGRGLEAVPAW